MFPSSLQYLADIAIPLRHNAGQVCWAKQNKTRWDDQKIKEDGDTTGGITSLLRARCGEEDEINWITLVN